MPIKDRKLHRQRGTNTCGRGKKGSRRKGGGRGMAGSKKHKKSWVLKYMPDHIGSDSMKSLQKKPKPVNIGYLNDYALMHDLKEVDPRKLGFEKVLGGGKVTFPIALKAAIVTEKAKAKVEAAGGKIIG